MTTRIRQMRAADLAVAVELYKDANTFASKRKILRWTREDLRRFPAYHLVCEQDGTIIGAISGTLHRKGLGVVEDIAVRKECRNQRIGDRLLRRLLTLFAHNGIRRVSLWVHWTDARAIPFYYRHGFRLRRFRHTHGMKDVPENEDILVLERQV